MTDIKGTTIIAVKQGTTVAIGGDGQVTLGSSILKSKANKVRRLYDGSIIAGFAGSTADAFTLYEKLEEKLEAFKGNLKRAAVELAKDWRSDKILRRLEAMIIVANHEHLLVLTGLGDVLEPDDDLIAIGSGGSFALAAARALVSHTKMKPREIVNSALNIACQLCIYTNDQITIEVLEP